jgi:glycosyltransferase involved in cell wall biosynthesis
MPPEVTVVIPTYNGARRLPLLLQALMAQDAPGGSFEVVVVDNNSTDDTATVVNGDASTAVLRARGIECRVVRETRQGETFARIAGVLAARAPLVCFLDDDNIPAAGYLRVGASSLCDQRIGLLISKVTPQWPSEPPPSIARRSGLFALNGYAGTWAYLGESPIDYGTEAYAPTLGAGMWVRREYFIAAVISKGSDALLPGPQPHARITCEDTEIGVLIGRAGYRRVYVPQLELKHLIERHRLGTVDFSGQIIRILRSKATLESRYYSRRFGLTERARAGFRLGVALLAIPAVMVTRRDGVREAIFIVAGRWADFVGPYPKFARPQR